MSEIELILAARHIKLGAGFEVDRLLPSKRRTLGPFVLLDHGGPAEHAPGEGFAILPHPHIGISTLTYVFAGEMVHRDSLGNTRPIRPGEVNLMTAGRGIVHSERASPKFAASGGSLHVLQLWVGLTGEHEELEPSFEHLDRDELPLIRAAERSRVMLLGGARIAPPHMWWNFVSTRVERIEQAKHDWSEGRFLLPPDDKDEWIPLPSEPAPRPEPLS